MCKQLLLYLMQKTSVCTPFQLFRCYCCCIGWSFYVRTYLSRLLKATDGRKKKNVRQLEMRRKREIFLRLNRFSKINSVRSYGCACQTKKITKFNHKTLHTNMKLSNLMVNIKWLIGSKSIEMRQNMLYERWPIILYLKSIIIFLF